MKTHKYKKHDRRRSGRVGGLPGVRHAALLRQRPPPRRRAAAGQVREDHRRGDQEGPGPARQGHQAGRISTTTLIKDGKGPADAEKKTVALSPSAPAKGNQNAKVVIQELLRLPVPVLQEGRGDVNEVMKNYGQQGEDRLAQHPAADAPGRAARRGGRDGGVQAEGQRRLLEDARQALRAPRARRTA